MKSIARTLLIFVLASYGSLGVADELELFTYLDDKVDLSSNKYSSPAAISTSLVEVNVNALASQQPITVLLPDNIQYRAVAPTVQKRNHNSLTWRSRLVGPDGSKGTATISVVEGIPAGSIKTSNAAYELVPYSGNRSLLQEIDESLYPPDQQPVDPLLENEPRTDQREGEPLDDRPGPAPGKLDR